MITGRLHTTGAVCGQIAGAYYGLDAIPARWVEELMEGERIVRTAEMLVDAGMRG